MAVAHPPVTAHQSMCGGGLARLARQLPSLPSAHRGLPVLPLLNCCSYYPACRGGCGANLEDYSLSFCSAFSFQEPLHICTRGASFPTSPLGMSHSPSGRLLLPVTVLDSFGGQLLPGLRVFGRRCVPALGRHRRDSGEASCLSHCGSSTPPGICDASRAEGVFLSFPSGQTSLLCTRRESSEWYTPAVYWVRILDPRDLPALPLRRRRLMLLPFSPKQHLFARFL